MAKQNYDPAEIEPRWQAFWAEHSVFRTPNPGDPDFDSSKPKYYALDMFPYPSGAGLHVGHPEGYTATDILSRYKRMTGHNVLHPMGWDAFGLPAEQYAIQTGTHPEKTTRANIDNFRRQLQSLGFSYDWDREVGTCDPDYFKWTQWIFKKLHEKGLAYQSNAPVWWCEELGTVLSNDEVINGRSERGDHPCERRPLRQWMLKITDYAQRLLDDLDEVDWSESLKTMQREWIGRSEGAEIDFGVDGHDDATIRVFTTRPDTLFGASFMVLAPEHPLVARITSADQKAAVDEYIKKAAAKSELERTDLAKETTGCFTGAYALNPLFSADDPRAKLPVWIADYVIVSYGTGAIMAVPAGDERDFRFANEFGIPVPAIFSPDSGDAELDEKVRRGKACWTDEAKFINSSNDQGLDLSSFDIAAAKRAVIDWLGKRNIGEAKITYRLRDWLFSRQRYWGEPFPVLLREDGTVELLPDDALPLELPPMEDFAPGGQPESPLIRAKDWVATTASDGKPAEREINTMPGAAGSSWYFLRFCDPKNSDEFCSRAASDYWMPVDQYVGGTEHAVGHLLYARFWTKVLYDLGLVKHSEPFQRLYNQGMIQSFAYQDDRGATIAVADVEERDGKFVHKETGAELSQIVTKMSKRYGNVVNPDDVVNEYGADTLRLYEMYMGPLADAKPWNPKDVPGVHRFLRRAWRIVVPEAVGEGDLHPYLEQDRDPDADLERLLHKTIDKVEKDIERMAFNTAIAAMIEFVNAATKAGDKLTRSQGQRFAQILSPFAPHLAEELYARLGGEGMLAHSSWPTVDPAQLVADTVEIPVQVLGKVRARIQVAAGSSEDEILSAARAAIETHVEGKTIVKEIVVKGRIVNFVVK